MQVLLLHCVAPPSSSIVRPALQRCKVCLSATSAPSYLLPTHSKLSTSMRAWPARDRITLARSRFFTALERVFKAKSGIRTDLRRLWERSESISRAHLALNREAFTGAARSLSGSSFGIVDTPTVISTGAEASSTSRLYSTAVTGRASGQRLQKARESRLVFRRKTRDLGAAAPKRIADPAAPYTRTLPRQRVSPRNLWRKR